MKILYVTGRSPCPPTSGTPLRVLHVGRALGGVGQLSMAIVPISSEDLRNAKEAEQEFGPTFVCRKPLIEPREPEDSGTRLGRVSGMRHDSAASLKQDLQFIRGLADQSDVVWIHSLMVASALSLARAKPVIVDLDDLFQEKYRLAAAHADTWRQWVRYQVLRFRWRRQERLAVGRYTGVVVCSQPDKSMLGGGSKIHVISNGFESTPVVPHEARMRLGFIGGLGYWANRDGLAWFAQKVWPAIHARFPEATFRVVGSGPAIRELKVDGIEELGFVRDVGQEFGTWSAMMVPLRIGGGTRIKILEAFSRKCPVISTALGAHGLDVEAGTHYLCANTPDEMLEAVSTTLSDQSLCHRLVTRAHALFREQYDWKVISNQVASVVTESVGDRARNQAMN